MLLVDIPRRAALGHADRRRLADHLADHPTGAHHPDGAQRLVGDADAATGHEQVVDVARVEAAVGHRVAVLAVDGLVEVSRG